MSDTAVIEQDVQDVQDEQTAEAAPAETPEPAQTEQVAETAKSDDRYPAKEIGQALGQRLAAAHEAGWTRPRISALVAQVNPEDTSQPDPELDAGLRFKMGGSALWRSRDGRVHAGEVPYLTAVLDWIDAGVVTLPERPTKDVGKLKEQRDALQSSLDKIAELAESSVELKGVAPLREVLAAIAEQAKA